jgi:hypothetical protein
MCRYIFMVTYIFEASPGDVKLCCMPLCVFDKFGVCSETKSAAQHSSELQVRVSLIIYFLMF